MKFTKSIFLFLLFSVVLFAFELDVESLIKKVSNNPDDIKNRLVLAKYFLEKEEYKKAKQFIDEILKVDPSNRYAKEMKKKIDTINYISQLKKSDQTFDDLIDEYYKKNRYKEILKIYRTLEFLYPSKKDILQDRSYLKVARVAMWKGDYNLSLKVLNKVKDKKNLDFFEIKAYNCYYIPQFKCAKKYFQYLFQATGDIEYAKKLLDIYIALGDLENAKKILLSIKRTQNNSDLVSKYEKKILELENRYLKHLKEKYSKNPTFENLKALVFIVYSKTPQKAINLVKDYIKNNPLDDKAKIFLAKLLSWSGDNKEALNILTKLQKSNIEAKLLLGKILAWQGEYDKAIELLSEVFESGSKVQKYEAKKMIGYIYLWKKKKEDAKKIFEELIKENPKDKEIKESLLLIKGNIKPLIKKYKKLLAKNPKDETIILKLAEYYYMTKDYEKAIKYYEKYLQLHPEKIELYKTIGDIYLELKSYYKAFGAWEYYANYKGTKESFYQLAQRYYWNGFNNEALLVLNDLLRKYPNYKEAAILKAKILKINPRFVMSKSSATIDDYFYNKSKKILALADRTYFENLYHSAADYYKTYLSLQPEDYKAREKYAFALEASKEYEKAAGEFYLLLWMDNRPEIMYHYAYNLQKSGNIQKAKKIYTKLLNEVPKEIPPFIDKFLKEWEAAWESMDIKRYLSFYGKKFYNNIRWRLRKEAIFRKSSFISVGIYSPLLIAKKGDLYRVRFYQVYASKIKKDEGYKTLDIVCKNKVCKIVKESWKPGKYIPYKKDKSLEFYIKQRLKEIQLGNKIVDKKKIYKSSETIPVEKDLEKEEVALNYLYLEPENLKKNKVIPKVYKEGVIQQLKAQTFGIEGKLNYFQDNQNIDMLTYQLKTFKNINNSILLYLFFTGYNLNDDTKKANGHYYGIGIKKDNFYGDLFLDKSGANSNIGWGLTYLTDFLDYELTFKFNKKNLIYSRHTYCSKELMRLKGEVSGYKTLPSKRGFWWSLAQEKIDDKNLVTTLQFDYDFYEKSFGNFDTLYTIAGWYQFNSKTTSCYYSPKKADSNYIGVKGYYPLNKKFNIHAKAFFGYSFWQKALLYKTGLWLKNNSSNEYNFELGCDFSNSSSTGISNEYRSLECALYLRRFW